MTSPSKAIIRRALLLWITFAIAAVPLRTQAEVTVSNVPVPALGYKAIPDFFKLTKDWSEGEASGVAINSKGHIYLFRRAKPFLTEFDQDGAFIRSFDNALFDHPHGIRIDHDDNLWTTDDVNNTVLKLSPTGQVLLVLGRRNTGGEGAWVFNKPADVGFSRDGDIYVADGYGNSRIVKFDRDGNFIKAWGSYGAGPGEFDLPHSVVVDRTGRVIVADRENGRIQVFSSDGKFLEEWKGIGYPYGLALTPDDHIWMADGGFDRIVELDLHGKILGAFGSPGHRPGQLAWAHFLAVSDDKKIFVADVLNWRFQVFGPTSATGGVTDYVPSVRQFWDYKKSDGWSFRDQPGIPKR